MSDDAVLRHLLAAIRAAWRVDRKLVTGPLLRVLTFPTGDGWSVSWREWRQTYPGATREEAENQMLTFISAKLISDAGLTVDEALNE